MIGGNKYPKKRSYYDVASFFIEMLLFSFLKDYVVDAIIERTVNVLIIRSSSLTFRIILQHT